MKKFKFKKIDAFATEKSDGNPAGYVRLGSKSDISADEMQRIAKELKGYVNEVGFIYKVAPDEFNLKYYSAEKEVDFCGHATVAIMYDILKEDESFNKFDSVKINTNRGRLEVRNRIFQEDAVFIFAPVPEERSISLDLKDIAANLKIRPDEISGDHQISIINAGLTTLLVPIVSLRSILGISPDSEMLKRFCQRSDIDIVEVYTGEVRDKSNNFRTRVFCPIYGYLEDPATGSGNSAFGYHLIKKGCFSGSTISIEQNGYENRYNIVRLRREKDENGSDRILFGGGAKTRLDGDYILN